MFDFNFDLSIRKQADLLGCKRSFLYYKKIQDDSEMANLIKDIYSMET